MGGFEFELSKIENFEGLSGKFFQGLSKKPLHAYDEDLENERRQLINFDQLFLETIVFE